MRRSSPVLAILLLVLAGACSTDDGDDETTTDAPTTTADDAPSDVPPAVDGIEGLAPLPGVEMLVTFAIDGGQLVVEATVSNDSDDDVAVLSIDSTSEIGDGSQLVAARSAVVDGDDAPPQVDAVFVASGATVTMSEELGSPDLAPTGDLTVCLEGEVVAGGPAPSDDDPPLVRIGPRDDGAGVVCSDPTPTGR